MRIVPECCVEAFDSKHAAGAERQKMVVEQARDSHGRAYQVHLRMPRAKGGMISQ